MLVQPVTLLRTAEHLYRTDGGVMPMLVMETADSALIFQLKEDPVPSAAMVSALVLPFVEARSINLVSETWTLNLPPGEELPEDFQHGDLGRMEAAGDARVQTLLLVWTLDVATGRFSSLASRDAGTHFVPVLMEDATVEGRMVEMFAQALEAARAPDVRAAALDTDLRVVLDHLFRDGLVVAMQMEAL